MKLLAIVITYFPDVEELRRNILQYIEQVDKLIIWENTPKDFASEYKIELPQYPEKIIVNGTGKNEFIAYPLNKTIKWAKTEGFTHLLTMDQDSCFEEGVFKKYVQTIAATEASDIGIWGANPNNMYNAETPILEVPQCITSGTIYPLSVFDKIGLFREDFAIYVVDIEFGIRARKYGYKTVVVPAATLRHTFGRPTKTIFGYTSSNYSPFITYLIIRNTIVTWIEYPDHFKVRKGFIQYTILYRILAIILHEKQKWKKLKAIAWGICDGIRRKMNTRTF
jgi:hypothetical protein